MATDSVNALLHDDAGSVDATLRDYAHKHETLHKMLSVTIAKTVVSSIQLQCIRTNAPKSERMLTWAAEFVYLMYKRDEELEKHTNPTQSGWLLFAGCWLLFACRGLRPHASRGVDCRSALMYLIAGAQLCIIVFQLCVVQLYVQ